MKTTFKHYLIAVLTTFTNFTYASNLDKLFLEKDYWAKFNWDNVEKSEIYLDNRLDIKKPENNEEKSYYEKFGDVEINGIQFKESILKKTNLSKNERVITLAIKTELKNQNNEETCGKVIGIFEKVMGNNYEFTEYKSVFDNTPMLSKSKKFAEWLNGKTNIKIQCIKLFSDNYYVNVSYTPNLEENKVKKPIKLSCERNYSSSGSSQLNKASAIHFTVLQEEMEIINTDNNLMGRIEEITNSFIRFSNESDEAKQTYTINRIDGTLSGTFLNIKTNKVQAVYSGTCTKRMNDERKF
jgi:hypothetical protein